MNFYYFTNFLISRQNKHELGDTKYSASLPKVNENVSDGELSREVIGGLR